MFFVNLFDYDNLLHPAVLDWGNFGLV